jgi:phosphoribosylamine--glycine ligase
MRILFISKEGDGLGIAQRLMLEGHSVDVWCAEERFERAGRGIVNRVKSWEDSAPRADLIIADSVGLGKLEDKLRAYKAQTLGFSALLDVIELNRAKGMEMFERAGVTIPDTYEFDTPKAAASLTKHNGWGDGWVVKPNGNISTAKTMTCRDERLWERTLGKLSPECSGIVQRLVSGIEVSTEGWFNGTDFVTPFNHTFEDKRFLTGNLGVNTGCMGNIVLRADSDRLTAATVERVAPFLRMIGYRGPFDINCIVNESGAYALEATSRMGYDAVEALIEGLEEEAGTFLFDVAAGTKKTMELTDETMIAVRLSIPPWPVRRPDKTEDGEPVLGITDDRLYHLFLTDLEKTRSGYVTAGGDGVLLKATAVGNATSRNGNKPDITYEARRRVYRLLDKIEVAGKQYRVDIGSRVNDDVARLKQWGWL